MAEAERKIEKRYLHTSAYNRCLVINQLRQMVKERGGKLIYYPYNWVEVENRDLPITINEKQISLERIRRRLEEGLELTTERVEYIQKIERDIKDWKNIDNTSVLIQGGILSLSFVYQGVYYYFWCEDNPFFPPRFQKQPVIDNKIGRNYYAEDMKSDWVIDPLFSFTCTKEDREKAVSLLWEILISAPVSEHFRNIKRKRVPNIYNGGYHYETIETPEEFVPLKFEEE